MSARRVLGVFVLALAAGAAAARPARAQDSIVVAVGGQLAARAGQIINVPVTVDMRAAPGRTLGGYTLALTFDTTVFYYYGDSTGSFAAPQVNTDSSAQGRIRFAAIMPAGATGLVTLFTMQLYVKVDTLVSPITLTPVTFTAAAGSVTPYEDLLPLVRVANGAFCRSLGTWGDLDGDGQENSRDALGILSVVVGLPVDTLVMKPALGDVDGDGRITSRDALIVLSEAVGLPVTGYRIGQVAAGACGTGNATLLAILPDSLELSAGQTVPIVLQATDATGRVVSIPNVTWTSSNSNVAMYASTLLGSPPAGSAPGRFGGVRPNAFTGAGIQARSAGVAILTATLSPGISAQLKVVVLAHRTTWYVDVQRARMSPTQAGSAQFPFEFVGDAVDPAIAANGDTVLVAGGEYDEVVSSALSVVVRGDSTNRPVIDSRGAPYYYAGNPTVSLGSATGRMELTHAIVRGGGVYLQGHDIAVRDVGIQMLGGTSEGLYISSLPTSGLGTTPGNVLVDHVTSDGAITNGIMIATADTATVTNNTIARDSAFTGTCVLSRGTASGIGIDEANASLVQGNTVTDPQCAGIVVYQSAGRARISRNAILRPSGAGIVADAPVVATDHNVIRTVAAQAGNLYQGAYGIIIDNFLPVDSASSAADSVTGMHGAYPYAGLFVKHATVVSVDSLVADSIGDVGVSTYGSGVQADGQHIAVTRSRLTHLVGSGIEAGTAGFEFLSQGNVIANAQGSGIQFVANCDCSVTPDTLQSLGDSISFVGFAGLDFTYPHVAIVQNAVIDSTSSYGIYLYQYLTGTSASVTGSKVTRSGTGVYVSGFQTLQLSGDSLLQNGEGVYLYYVGDSVRVTGTTIANGTLGLYSSGTAVRMDSSVISGMAAGGMQLVGAPMGYVTRSRFSNDSIGIWLQGAYNPGAAPFIVTSSNLTGNLNSGLRSEMLTDTVVATGNWWNNVNGPRCDSTTTGIGCSLASGDTAKAIAPGDSVTQLSGGNLVKFSGWLGAPAATPAPRAFASAAVRRAVPAAQPAPGTGAARVGPAAARIAAPPPPALAPRVRHPFPAPWQKGREPRTTRTASQEHEPSRIRDGGP